MRKYGDDIDKMQQDAVRRMQEMQSRGKAGNIDRMGNPHSVAKPNNNTENTADCEKEDIIHNPHINTLNENSRKKEIGFFDALFKDKERSLILLLLILLSVEKTDTGLILALIYLLI